jgi:hypothetical protein
MVICSNCGSPGIDGVRSCPACGAETPLVSGLESPALHLRSEPAPLEITANLNVHEVAVPRLNIQSLPPRYSETVGPQLIRRSAAIPATSTGMHARSPLFLIAMESCFGLQIKI